MILYTLVLSLHQILEKVVSSLAAPPSYFREGEGLDVHSEVWLV